MSLETVCIKEHLVLVKQEFIEEEHGQQVKKEPGYKMETVVIKQEPDEIDEEVQGKEFKEPDKIGEAMCIKMEINVEEDFAKTKLVELETQHGKVAACLKPGSNGLSMHQPAYVTVEVPAAKPICKPEPVNTVLDPNHDTVSFNQPTEHYECHDCGKQYTNKSDLEVHMHKHSSMRRGRRTLEECHVCKKSVLRVNMRRHLTTHDKTHVHRLFPCTLCDKTYKTKRSFKTHVATHTGELNYGCEHCSLRFPTKRTALRHAIIHKPERYECEVCQKSFRLLKNYSDHKRLHLKKEFTCEICHKEFVLKWYLVQHMRIHTGERNFSCDSCDKKFRSKSHLNRHKRTHSGLKPHLCDICHESFANLFSLKAHRDEHTRGRPHVCETCGKRFLQRSTMLDHRKMHTSEQYRCKVCGMQFATRGLCVAHRRTHDAPRFRCDQCGKEYAQRTSLEEHIKGHEGVAAHNCAVCGAAYAHASSLCRHMRTRHASVPVKDSLTAGNEEGVH